MPDVSSRFLDQTTALPTLSAGDLALYELQQPFVEPLLRMFRFTNTALDVLFYDVEALRLSLLAKNTLIHTSLAARSVSHPFDFLDLTALTNPSGSIIVVDSNSAPYIRPPFREMSQFFDYANGPDGAALHTLAITGVGSSAYGAVAFAWDISTALGELVAAVVPGYGLADVVPQALGGWFGFEVYDALQTATQSFLARFAPSLALIGKISPAPPLGMRALPPEHRYFVMAAQHQTMCMPSFKRCRASRA